MPAPGSSRRGLDTNQPRTRKAAINMVSNNFDNIPSYLKENARFCLWRYEERSNGKGETYLTKPPYNAVTGRYAESNNPDTFTDYETAHRVFVESGSYDGMGAGVFDGLSAIDIDHCITLGKLSPMAREIVEAMDTYTEISPSGEGLRLFFLAPGYSYDSGIYYINSRAAGDKAKENYKAAGYKGGEGLEVYIYGMTKKYVTITGNAINEKGVEERADRLPAILEKFMRRDGKPVKDERPNSRNLFTDRAASYQQARETPRTPDDLTDDELLERAFAARNGFKIFSLWNGDIAGYESQSEADQALCNYLAFWTGCNEQRIDSLFRQSGLYRPKWDEKHGADTYGNTTIAKAVEGCRETYTPGKDKGVAPGSFEGGNVSEERRGESLPYNTVSVFVSEKPADVAQGIFDCRYEETPIQTGFMSLDTALYGGLRSGLVTIGAISSAGKTTLLNQLGDYISANGTPVLFCSIEQTARELVGKSLSRMMAQRGYNEVGLYEMENSKYRPYKDGAKEYALAQCLDEYRETIAPNLTIMTARREQPTVYNIETAALMVAGEHGKSPLVIVDYLQLIQPASEKMSDKQATDVNVSRLRLLANKLKTPVIVISSLNRASYNTGIERSSFKESGMVEYSSDILLGLQPRDMKKTINEKVKNANGEMKPPTDMIKALRADNLLDDFMKSDVKECELVFLKHRNGKMPNKPLPFTFYAASSFFVEGKASKDGADSVGEWFIKNNEERPIM